MCRHTGLNWLCKPAYGGLGLILMFHRIAGAQEKIIDQSGVVSGKFFDRLLGYIKATGPEIIFLRDAPRYIAENKPFVSLTFDDGYRDNIEIALPVLRKHNVPATIFIPSGIFDRSLNAWWLQIEDIAKGKPNPRAAYEGMIAEIWQNPQALESFISLSSHDQKELNERFFLSSEEVKKISRDPLLDIGGHTLSHPRLKTLPEEEAFREIKQNKTDLENLLNRPVEAFAYPYGDPQTCGPREFELVEKAGYKVAVTTRDGNVLPAHKNNLMALPRYSVRGFLENLAVYDMQRNGTYRALKSRLGPALVTE